MRNPIGRSVQEQNLVYVLCSGGGLLTQPAPASLDCMIIEHEVIYGDRAVWVNGVNGCLGRFGQMGIDVHRDPNEQIAGLGQCLFCTHEKVGPIDWPRFVQAMQQYHQIDLMAHPMPAWLK